MTKRREDKLLEAKKVEWDLALRGFDRFWEQIKTGCKKTWKEIKWGSKIMINWYFFYQPTNKGDKALHIVLWILYTLALLRIFRFI